MAYANDIISAPVSIYDVQRAIGSSSGDLGTLCTRNTINQWSKMKPVAFPYVEPDRVNPMSAYGRTQMWWKGHPQVTEVAAGLVIGNYTCQSKCAWITCCGIKFLGFSNQADVRGALNPIANPYQGDTNNPLYNNFIYVPPTGGTAEPYRLVDFNNYWHKAFYNIATDYETEIGTVLIDPQNPNESTQKCSLFWYDTNDTSNYISFLDLFDGDATFSGFTVVLGKLNGSTFDPVSGVSITETPSSQLPADNYKEVKIDLSSLNNVTIIAFYCAYVSIGGSSSYYVPIMQSTGVRTNTMNTSFPNRRMFRSWRVEHIGGTYYPMSFGLKVNYGTSFPFLSSPFNGLTLGGASVMNRIYIKIEVPRDASNTLTFGYNSIKVEFDGMFLDSQNRTQLIYYELTSADTRFVLKNSEPTVADWGSSETVIVTPGTGTQTCYLAIYNLFANRHSLETIYGGTVYRVIVSIADRDDWYAEYGGLATSEQLSINVNAITA